MVLGSFLRVAECNHVYSYFHTYIYTNVIFIENLLTCFFPNLLNFLSFAVYYSIIIIVWPLVLYIPLSPDNMSDYILCIKCLMLIFILYLEILVLINLKNNLNRKYPNNNNNKFILILILLGFIVFTFDLIFGTLNIYTIIYIMILLVSIKYINGQNHTYIDKNILTINKIYLNKENISRIKQSKYYLFKVKLGQLLHRIFKLKLELNVKDLNKCKQLQEKNDILRESLPNNKPFDLPNFIVLSILSANMFIFFYLFLYKLYILEYLTQELAQFWSISVPTKILVFTLVSILIKLVLKIIIQKYPSIFSKSVIDIVNHKFNCEDFKNAIFTYDWFKFRVITSIAMLVFSCLFITLDLYNSNNMVSYFSIRILMPFLSITTAYCVTTRIFDKASLYFILVHIFFTILLGNYICDNLFIHIFFSYVYFTSTHKPQINALNNLANKLHTPKLDSNAINNWFENLSNRIQKISNNQVLDNLTPKKSLLHKTWNPIKAFVKLLNLKADYSYIPAWAWISAEKFKFIFVECKYNVVYDIIGKFFHFTRQGDIYFVVTGISIDTEGKVTPLEIISGYHDKLSSEAYVYFTQEIDWTRIRRFTRELIPNIVHVNANIGQLLYSLKLVTTKARYCSVLTEIYDDYLVPKSNYINDLNGMKIRQVINYNNLGVYRAVGPVYFPFKTTLCDANYLVARLMHINKLLIKDILPRIALILQSPYKHDSIHPLIVENALVFCDTYYDHMSCLYHYHRDLYLKLFNMERPKIQLNSPQNVDAIQWIDWWYGTDLVNKLPNYFVHEENYHPHPTFVYARYNIRCLDPSINVQNILTRNTDLPVAGWNHLTLYQYFGLNVAWSLNMEEGYNLDIALNGYLTKYERYFLDQNTTEFRMKIHHDYIIDVLKKLDIMNRKNSNVINTYIKNRPK